MAKNLFNTALIFLSVFNIFGVFAQTQISGIVYDAENKEPLPYATVAFAEAMEVGCFADFNGKFILATNKQAENLIVSFVGYKTQTIPIKQGKTQKIEIGLEPESKALDEVVIKSRKAPYSNRNNPAVDMLREIVRHKNYNRIESNDYYRYDRYEKLELAFNNFRDSTKNYKGLLKQADVLFNYADTSELTGQRILPFYFSEKASEIFYRKSPKTTKQLIKAQRSPDIHNFVDMNSINTFINSLFNPIDLYDNDVMLLQVKFMSPLSPAAPFFFRYHIIDTVDFDGSKCVRLSFYPRNTGDQAFSGDIYVLADTSYAVKQINMRIPQNTGINFVRKFSLTHTFSNINGKWCISIII